MDTVLKTFGVQPILLLAQVVNFLVLLFILKRFMYKPILKVLDERRKKISKSLRDAEAIERRLLEIEQEREDRLKETMNEAKRVIADASRSAAEMLEDSKVRTEENIAKMLKKNSEAMAREREKLRMEIRAELADLVVVGMEKVAKKSLTSKDQKEMVKKAVSSLV